MRARRITTGRRPSWRTILPFLLVIMLLVGIVYAFKPNNKQSSAQNLVIVEPVRPIEIQRKNPIEVVVDVPKDVVVVKGQDIISQQLKNVDNVVVDMPKNDSALRPPPPPVITEPVYLTLEEPNGRFCNQLLTFSTAIERVKRRRETVLLIWGEWSRIYDLFDANKLDAWLGGPGRIRKSNGRSGKAKSTSAWWDRACAERVSRESIRKAMRPSSTFQQMAESRIRNLHEQGAKQILAVHRRALEGTCQERTNNADKYGVHCHRTSSKYQGTLNQCNYMSNDEFFSALKGSWSNFRKEEMGLFLSSDGRIPVEDSMFRAPFKYSESTDGSSAPSSMLVDMWTSVLADFYVANTMSSCEGIVAQWRREIKGENVHPVYPPSCFGPYNTVSLKDEPLCGPGAKWDDYY